MNNLGNILKERNELVEAEELLSKAVSIQYATQPSSSHPEHTFHHSFNHTFSV